jgi:hypothetical protein
MSRTFFFSRNPLAKEMTKLEKVETSDFGEDPTMVERRVLNPDGSVVQAWKSQAGGAALDPEDNPTYKGDRLILRGEERDRSGNIVQTYERIDEHGEYQGTIETTWEQTNEFQRTHTKTRHIRS